MSISWTNTNISMNHLFPILNYGVPVEHDDPSLMVVYPFGSWVIPWMDIHMTPIPSERKCIFCIHGYTHCLDRCRTGAGDALVVLAAVTELTDPLFRLCRPFIGF